MSKRCNKTCREVLFVALLLPVLLFGCCDGRNTESGNDGTVESVMACNVGKAAEKLMQKNPDSALVVLEGIDRGELEGERQRALYALLLSQARDKCYIDSDNDSVISIAYDYFKESGDEYRKMLSVYYRARVKYNAKEYPQAILDLLEAESLAKKLDDKFYLGLIYRDLSNSYNNIRNNAEHLKYARSSYESFVKLGRMSSCGNAEGEAAAVDDYTYYIDWALLDVARAYHNHHEYDKSIPLSRQIIAYASGTGVDSAMSASVNVDSRLDKGKHGVKNTLLVGALRIAGTSYLAVGDNLAAKECFTRMRALDEKSLSASDYRHLGAAWFNLGQIDSAQMCAKILMKLDPKDQWLKYGIENYHGNYKAALEALKAEYDSQGEVLTEVFSQNVSSIISDYYTSVQNAKEREIQYQKRVKALSITALLTILALVVVFFWERSKSQKKEMENSMLVASNLRSILEIRESELAGMRESINNLFVHKFNAIDNLVSEYYEYQGTVNEKQRLHKSVTALISQIGSSPDTIAHIEQSVNTAKNNIVERLSASFPNLKYPDRLLFLYIAAGFSPRAISIFIGEDISVVYNRKARLKKKLERSAYEGKVEFLELL